MVAADVCSMAPHTGRGGWTWYSGSAGWMYRLLLESLLGLRREGETLHLSPCLPEDWPGFKVHYRYRATVYHIAIASGAEGTASLAIDGLVQEGSAIRLVDDRIEHHVLLVVSPEAAIDPARRSMHLSPRRRPGSRM